jgi:alkylation response protein AidB-like acyl-CoA dehydrogenase
VSQAGGNRYKTNLRELSFVLFEQLGFEDILGKEPFAAWGREEVEMALGELDRLAKEVLGPLNSVGDRVGCRLEDGQVITPPGFKEAWKRVYDGGWRTLTLPEERGGQGAPRTLGAILDEFMAGSNCAFAMYSGLSQGAAEVIEAFGTPEQKKRYLDKMNSGVWAGTMCLTEPQAGSDVGAASTAARRLGDGTYAIKGTKIFISGGDQDITENIIHLVLARVEGAPPGTKGLSLFIVPKRKLGADGAVGARNDVATASIEHKMGINGSATCVLAFGENDECVGELVGAQENSGMSQMFHLMNSARIGVGLQGLGLASSAYLNALEYAHERKQGAHIMQYKDASAPRVPIIDHPDVRRMLLEMKGKVEGIRALIYKLALHRDKFAALDGKDDAAAAYHRGQVDLLVPIVKAYSTDQAFHICEMAIQIYGGAGFLKDHPVEQYCRDAKVFSIYEGTNHIQAMDLVGRKLGQGGGANFRAFLGEIGAFVQKHTEHPVLGADVKRLGDAAETIAMVAGTMLLWATQRKVALVPLAANRFLEMMGETAIAWLLLDGARIALDKLHDLPADSDEAAFYLGKKHSALFFVRNVLPSVFSKSRILTTEDTSALEIPDAGF